MISLHCIRTRPIGLLLSTSSRYHRLRIRKHGEQLRIGRGALQSPTRIVFSSQGQNGSDHLDEEEEEEEEISQNPWKGLLELPARASWRVTDPQFPINLARTYDKILAEGDRTPKQLKRAHRKVLAMHTDLAEFRERERRRMVNGKAAQNLSDEDGVHPVYYRHDQTLATLKHRLLPNYAIARRVLEECRSLLGSDCWSPKRVVDFGIGCGSSSAAALDLFDGIEWIHGIDPSQPMRECSQRLLEGMTEGREVTPRVTYSNSLSAESTSTGGTFDLALCAYTATDLPGIMSTLAASAILFQKLKPDGVLVMIEPGTPDGFNSTRAVRNMLLDCCPPDDPDFEWKERCQIIAPCTHNGPCPMVRHKRKYAKRGKLAYDIPQGDTVDDKEKNPANTVDWENFTDEFDGDFIEVSSVDRLSSETDSFNSAFCSFVHTLPGKDSSAKGEKFSYLVAQKRIYNSPENVPDQFKDDNVTNLLALARDASVREDSEAAMSVFKRAQSLRSKYFDSDEDDLGFELLRGEEKRGSMGRIIRAPIKKKGHVYIDYCASPGRIIRSRVTKSLSLNVAPGMYTAARKSRWGGLWPDTMDLTFSPDK